MPLSLHSVTSVSLSSPSREQTPCPPSTAPSWLSTWGLETSWHHCRNPPPSWSTWPLPSIRKSPPRSYPRQSNSTISSISETSPTFSRWVHLLRDTPEGSVVARILGKLVANAKLLAKAQFPWSQEHKQANRVPWAPWGRTSKNRGLFANQLFPSNRCISELVPLGWRRLSIVAIMLHNDFSVPRGQDGTEERKRKLFSRPWWYIHCSWMKRNVPNHAG